MNNQATGNSSLKSVLKWLGMGLVTSSALALTTSAQEDTTDARLKALPVALIYHQISGEPVPVAEMMAEAWDKGYFDSEFEERRFVKENFDAFSQMAADALERDAHYAQFKSRIENYDFDKEQFALAGIFAGSMFFTYDASDVGADALDYAVNIINTDDVRFLKMPAEEAEAFMEKLGSDRTVRLRMWITPVNPVQAGWSEKRGDLFRTFNAVATKVEVLDLDNNLLAELDGAKPGKPVKAVKDNPIRMPDFSNPWAAEDAPAALLEHYDWVVNKKYKMQTDKGGDAFDEAINLRTGIAGGCQSKFGYSQCSRFVVDRRNMVNRCTNEIKPPKAALCYGLTNVPYSNDEADAY